jgi:anti-anti-sigma regulatory factor
MTEPPCLQLEKRDALLIARIVSPILLEPVEISRLSAALAAAIAEHAPAALLVNFADVARSSTEVINCLLVAKKKLLSEGGDLKLCDLRDSLRHTYRILNLDGTVFEIFETEEEAVCKLTGSIGS